MKRKLSGFLLLATMILLIVSCNNSINDADPTAYVNFAKSSREISSTVGIPGAEDYVWYYTATKEDSGLNTGAKSEETPVKEDSSAGLNDATIGPFSLGNWVFTLNGYTAAKDNSGVKVYSGTSSVITFSQKGEVKTVDVPVDYTGASGYGTVKFSNVEFITGSTIKPNGIDVIVSNSNGTEEVTYTLTLNGEYYTGEDKTLAAGIYKFTFSAFIQNDEVKTEVGNSHKYVLMMTGRDTIISGNIAEVTSGLGNTFNAEFKGYIVQGDSIILLKGDKAAFDGAVIEAISSNKQLLLNTDVVLDSTFVPSDNISIELNGHKISTVSNGTVVKVENGKNISITGGDIESTLYNEPAIIVENGATLGLSNCNVKAFDKVISNSGILNVNSSKLTGSVGVAIDNASAVTTVSNSILDTNTSVTKSIEGNVVAYIKAGTECKGNPGLGVLVFEDGDGTESNPYIIKSAYQLINLSDSVNNGITTYREKNIKLDSNIDFGGSEFRAIGDTVESYPSKGFAGIFDGNNKTISNVKFVSNDINTGHAATGLFGAITGQIKDITIDNFTVESTHYAGGVVGYSSTNVGMNISGCTVKNGTITTKPMLKDNSYDNGDKAGGIIGYCVSGDVVSNCKVENVTIKGYRDLGGIVGCSAGTISNCNVNNVTIIQDNTNGYRKGFKNTDDIVGRKENGLSNNNTASNVTYKVIGTVTSDNDLTYALTNQKANVIDIKLGSDVNFVKATDIPNYNNYYNNIGGINTTVFKIDGNNHKLTIDLGYRNSIDPANDNVVIEFKNMTISSNYFDKETWDSYDILFREHNAILENVKFDRAVALDGHKFILKNVEIRETTGEYYALWIQAGADVTIEDSLIYGKTEDATTLARAIKISDQYLGTNQDSNGTHGQNVPLTKLLVSNTKFVSEKKSAVLVGSNGGADIYWGLGNDISEVKADVVNGIWVDDGWTSTDNIVRVFGGKKIIEP